MNDIKIIEEDYQECPKCKNKYVMGIKNKCPKCNVKLEIVRKDFNDDSSRAIDVSIVITYKYQIVNAKEFNKDFIKFSKGWVKEVLTDSGKQRLGYNLKWDNPEIFPINPLHKIYISDKKGIDISKVDVEKLNKLTQEERKNMGFRDIKKGEKINVILGRPIKKKKFKQFKDDITNLSKKYNGQVELNVYINKKMGIFDRIRFRKELKELKELKNIYPSAFKEIL